MNLESILNFKKNNKIDYNKAIDKILSNNTFKMATRENEKINNPLVMPIKDTGLLSVLLFDTIDVSEEYKKREKIEFSTIKSNDFLLILNKLFFKGITGVIYNDDCNWIYINIVDLVKGDLIKNENLPLINVLNNIFYDNKYFNYIHDNTLTVDELLCCIVKYPQYKEGSKSYINLFENQEVADNYCIKKNIYGTNKQNFPVTTVVNDVLYHSIYILKDKIDFVKIHTQDKIYKVSVEDFINLIIKVGFKMLHLD